MNTTDIQHLIKDVLSKLSRVHPGTTSALRPLGVYTVHSVVYTFFQKHSSHSTHFQIAESNNALDFELFEDKACIQNGSKYEDIHMCSNFHITATSHEFIMTYTSTHRAHTRIRVASSPDLINWTFLFELPQGVTQAIITHEAAREKPYLLYFGRKSIRFVDAQTLKALSEENLYKAQDISQESGFNKNYAELSAVISTEHEALVVYHQKKRDGKKTFYTAGVTAYEKKNPKKAIRQTKNPLWQSPAEWSDKAPQHFGVINFKHHLISYWYVAGQSLYGVRYSYPELENTARIEQTPLLRKHHNNPILSPVAHNSWEAFNTFNPAAIYLDNKVHLIYRAQGFNYVSVLGYATSSDGLSIDERFPEPIYMPKEPFEYTGPQKPSKVSDMFLSGGGYGGCEDPRITQIDDRLYMTYVAYDGWRPPRVALTSISVSDFLKKNWNWTRPVLISPPHIVNKNAVIFPEKINGKYVIMHRVFPDILIDYVDSLEFDGTSWLTGHHKIPHRPDMWDSRKLGAGAPPLKTDDGWLLIYQAVDDRDPGRYKIGAMLLDLNNPHKVLYRCNEPILSPSERYEYEGFKAGVAYPCGAVIIDEVLHVYYGAADSHVAVATAPLSEFLHLLKTTGTPRMSAGVAHAITLIH